MIIQRLGLSVLPGREVELEAVLTETRELPFMSAGFRRLSVARGVEDPSRYVVDVLWETVEDLVAFGESPRAARWAAALRPFLAEAPRVEPLEQRNGLSLVSGGQL
jgi:heme-degrading monooxygenase HmoA